jgi:NAD(P)-dependent dehydrogenase (short-subunit alcohol dehydrogenase family)
MEEGPLAGRVVLVTGASKGIGAVTARELADAGALVIAHYNTDRAGAEAALAGVPETRRLLLQADAATPASMDALWATAEAWQGRIDAVVLNAAVMVPGGGIADPEAEWDAAWDLQWRVNVLSPTRLMRHAVRHFRGRDPLPGAPRGVLVTISSWAAQRGVTNPAMIAYAASKAAVKAAAQTIARGYATEGIISTIVAPGVVRTRMSEDFAATQGGEAPVTAMLAMGEWVPPEDIARTVAFLCEGRVRHLSGATLDVNGASYVR